MSCITFFIFLSVVLDDKGFCAIYSSDLLFLLLMTSTFFWKFLLVASWLIVLENKRFCFEFYHGHLAQKKFIHSLFLILRANNEVFLYGKPSEVNIMNFVLLRSFAARCLIKILIVFLNSWLHRPSRCIQNWLHNGSDQCYHLGSSWNFLVEIFGSLLIFSFNVSNWSSLVYIVLFEELLSS